MIENYEKMKGGQGLYALILDGCKIFRPLHTLPDTCSDRPSQKKLHHDKYRYLVDS